MGGNNLFSLEVLEDSAKFCSTDFREDKYAEPSKVTSKMVKLDEGNGEHESYAFEALQQATSSGSTDSDTPCQPRLYLHGTLLLGSSNESSTACSRY